MRKETNIQSLSSQLGRAFDAIRCLSIKYYQMWLKSFTSPNCVANIVTLDDFVFMLRKIDLGPIWQSFRTAPYFIMHTVLCQKKTIAQTIENICTWMPVAEIAGHHDRSPWDWSLKPSKVISVKTRRLVCVLLRRTQILHRNMNLKKCCPHLLLSRACDAFST